MNGCVHYNKCYGDCGNCYPNWFNKPSDYRPTHNEFILDPKDSPETLNKKFVIRSLIVISIGVIIKKLRSKKQ